MTDLMIKLHSIESEINDIVLFEESKAKQGYDFVIKLMELERLGGAASRSEIKWMKPNNTSIE